MLPAQLEREHSAEREGEARRVLGPVGDGISVE